MMSTKDIFWAAGLLEGEGYFGDVRHDQYCNALRLDYSTTDFDVAQRFADLAHSNVYGPYVRRSKRAKPVYTVCLSGSKAAGWMMTLYPLLGERRRSQIMQALNGWKGRRSLNRGT